MLRVTYYGLLIFNFDPPTGGFVRACPEFNSGMTATISVILNLIQNQLDPDFRQDDGCGTVTGIILSVSRRIRQNRIAKS